MPEQFDRHRILTLRARAAIFRRAASYMSLRAEKERIESHAAALEREADALEREFSDAAIARAEIVTATPTPAPASAAMKEDAEVSSPEKSAETPNAAMFNYRAERLRELAAKLSADDRELLSAIATDYEELARALAEAKSDPS